MGTLRGRLLVAYVTAAVAALVVGGLIVAAVTSRDAIRRGCERSNRTDTILRDLLAKGLAASSYKDYAPDKKTYVYLYREQAKAIDDLRARRCPSGEARSLRHPTPRIPPEFRK